MNDKPEHWAQSIRLGDIEDFYYKTFSGEYLNQITDEFLDPRFISDDLILERRFRYSNSS